MSKSQKVIISEKKKSPIIFSFFAGSGLLDLGFERTCFDVRFVNEFYKPFQEAYRYSRSQMSMEEPLYGYHQGSIEDFLKDSEVAAQRLKRDVKTAKKESLVGFVGGPPCPDFSAGGKNRGREGDNGRLTEAFVQVLVKHKPDFFLIENVKGLWKTEKHRVFYQEMKDLLEKSGFTIFDRLTNSIEFGVPQTRDRIFLFGIQKSLLNNKDIAFPWERYIRFDRKIINQKFLWPSATPYRENSILARPDFITDDFVELTVEYWFEKNNVEFHPNAQHHFTPRQALVRFQTIEEGNVKGKSFKRLHRWRYSPTAAYGNNEVHLHPYKSRRLSAAEALAIQSLPKDFVLPPHMKLSDMFKTIGNGVPFLLSEGIAKSIFDFLNEAT
ncbi:DNA cytosine methyltransferase [Acinetobacter radioresistens]|uniref:DNA cytosine methyltransferase n=1 Tax=Acinetobacter radioresistens TaxID=40216 RepID=UPI000DAD828C|nr:DNA cytosine methyltransferase [Acinetobacter radioresistens]AWV86168.1 modification methylase NmeDIP [Acinetobacter radioresistens]MCX0327694.1 DNA cytosine methyltransferase [Acinetobacter radioresistens]